MPIHHNEELRKVYSPKWWHGEFDYYVLRTRAYDGAITKHYVKRKYIKIAEELFGVVSYPDPEVMNYNEGKKWKP